MDHRGLVEQNRGFAHVAAADVEAGPVIHRGDAGEGLEGAEDVGGSARGRDHVERGQGDGLLLPGGVGAGGDDGFTQLDEGAPQHQAHRRGIAGGQVQVLPGRFEADEGGGQAARSEVPGGKGEAAVAAGCRAVGGVEDLHVDEGHRPLRLVDDLSPDESPVLHQGRQGEAGPEKENRRARGDLHSRAPRITVCRASR